LKSLPHKKIHDYCLPVPNLPFNNDAAEAAFFPFPKVWLITAVGYTEVNGWALDLISLRSQ
jgi:hypothetical protein